MLDQIADIIQIIVTQLIMIVVDIFQNSKDVQKIRPDSYLKIYARRYLAQNVQHWVNGKEKQISPFEKGEYLIGVGRQAHFVLANGLQLHMPIENTLCKNGTYAEHANCIRLAI